MSLASIGDLAQHLMLRRHTVSANRDLASLTADLAKGTASDVHRHLGGNLGPLAAIQSSLSQIDAYQSAAERGAMRAAAMQAALERLDAAATSNASDLTSAAQSGQSSSLATVAARASAALEDAVSALNTRMEGKSLFSGTAIDRDPLPGADELLALVKSAVAPATAPGDVAAALDLWLEDPAGFAEQAFGGNSDSRSFQIGPDQTAELAVTAADPALRQTFKGLILGALMSDPDFGSDSTSLSALARLAGDALSAGADGRVELAARIGTVEERLETSTSRLSAESSILQQARSDLVAVDAYETSTRLEETESRLELIYTLTARLSRLSLADFL